jgi:serine/threonine-protein kinase HipA
VKRLLAAGTGSLGGARPKAAVLDDDGHQMIAKFPHHADAWDVMAWEATALDLAAAAGVQVASHRLVRIEGRHVLLLRRFDRADDGARIGYISAMTALELHDGQHADYADVADSLTETSARAREDAHQLFRRVAVNVGLNNTDDHLRNHGFLRRRGGWTLSPAFDLNPNPEAELRQTTIGGADLPTDEADGLAELARACRLSPSQARSICADVAEAIDDWRGLAVRNGVDEPGLARFEASFTSGLRALREV